MQYSNNNWYLNIFMPIIFGKQNVSPNGDLAPIMDKHDIIFCCQ